MKYHVILTDECGDEFSVSIDATDADDAWETVAMDYPESCVCSVSRERVATRTYYEEDYSDWEYDNDDRSARQKEMDDRLDMGRNEAGEWLGFM